MVLSIVFGVLFPLAWAVLCGLPPGQYSKMRSSLSSFLLTRLPMKASALLLLLLPFTSNAAAPTAPDEADAGSIPVTAPVNVKSESLKLSPEQLVVASMPWVNFPPLK